MGLDNLCNLIASAVKKNNTSDSNMVKLGKITGSYVTIAGRQYTYTVAVDVPISDGDWVHIALSGSTAVVVGR